MKTKHLFGLTAALGCALAVPLLAQAGGQSDRGNPNENAITVTGCLQRNTSSAAAATTTTTTTTTGTAGAEQFVLIKGNVSPPNSGQWHSAKSNGPWYVVVGDPAGLRKDDNHLVEVTGTLDTTHQVAGATAADTDTAAGTIHVTEIKVLSGRCGE